MKTTYEVEKIVIERPDPKSIPFFGITLQKVSWKDGEIFEIKSRHDVLYLKETELANDEVDVHDNITGSDIHLSGDAVWLGLVEVCKDMVASVKSYHLNDQRELVDS